jgi:hypothetical protein
MSAGTAPSDMLNAYHLCGHRLQAPQDSSPFCQWTSPDGRRWADFHRQGSDYLVRFPELGDFLISRDGRGVHCWGAPQVSDETLRHLYLNQVMPLALSRQGKLVLHGSAVELDGWGLAFMGPSGRGKSTLAASFACSGLRFLTDDGLMLSKASGQWHVLPSHPSIRLWEDSEQALMPASSPKAPPVAFTSKSRFLASEAVVACDRPRPLRRMYFLGDRAVSAPVIQRLKPQEALIQLVEHSFLLDVEERKTLTAHFEELCDLVGLAAWYRLDYPRHFDELPRVRRAIMAHARDEVAGPDTAFPCERGRTL